MPGSHALRGNRSGDAPRPLLPDEFRRQDPWLLNRVAPYNVGMTVRLSTELQQALDDNRGFVQGPSYVLLSIDLYRDMMGVGSDAELTASIEAIEEGLADIGAGRTRPYNDVLAER